MNEIDIISTIKRDIQDLSISTTELNEIYLMFEYKDKVEIKNIINEIYKEISNELLLGNEELQRYIKKNLNSLVEIINNAYKKRFSR